MQELCCEPVAQRTELRIQLGLLPRVRVRRGNETQHVTFLSDAVLKALEKYYDRKSGYDPLEKDWDIAVASWAGTHKVYLPKSKKKDMIYRICFVVEASGDYIPLQQCVDTRHETTHFLEDSCWTVDQQELLKVWEPTAASDYLDDVKSGEPHQRKGDGKQLCPWKDEIDRYSTNHHGWNVPVKGPLKSFVKTALQPYHVGYLINNNVSVEKSGWRLMQGCRREPFPLGFGASQMIVFARSRKLDRWIVFPVAPYPFKDKQFWHAYESSEHGQGQDSSHWCIVWGRIPAGGRRVIALFQANWMIYDRYGLPCDESQPAISTTSAVQSRIVARPVQPGSSDSVDVAQVGSVQGPPPNTEYKVAGRDELSLDDDAMRYYEKVYAKRKGLADEIRSDAGECEFKLGDSLRVTWTAA